MRRFFSQVARKNVIPSAANTTQDQIQQISENPAFTKIIAKMQETCRHLQSESSSNSNNGQNILTAEKITRLLENEEENTKFSIY